MATDKDMAAADERVAAARHELKAALIARRLVLDRRKTPLRCVVTIQTKYLRYVPIFWLDISARARNALKYIDCDTLADAICVTRKELLSTGCCGEGTVVEIEAMLTGFGLSLKGEV